MENFFYLIKFFKSNFIWEFIAKMVLFHPFSIPPILGPKHNNMSNFIKIFWKFGDKKLKTNINWHEMGERTDILKSIEKYLWMCSEEVNLFLILSVSHNVLLSEVIFGWIQNTFHWSQNIKFFGRFFVPFQRLVTNCQAFSISCPLLLQFTSIISNVKWYST